jgi:hypothetical protein
LGGYEKKRAALGVERMRDYNDYLRQLSATHNRTWKIPNTEELLPLGKYEHHREKLKRERWQEYRDLMKKLGVVSLNLGQALLCCGTAAVGWLDAL